MDEREALWIATEQLPPSVAYWVGQALRSGHCRIGYGSFENDLTVCPVVAGAKMAGIWRDFGVVPGYEHWGTPDKPSEQVWEFVLAFDCCAEMHGVSEAVEVLMDALVESSPGVAA